MFLQHTVSLFHDNLSKHPLSIICFNSIMCCSCFSNVSSFQLLLKCILLPAASSIFTFLSIVEEGIKASDKNSDIKTKAKQSLLDGLKQHKSQYSFPPTFCAFYCVLGFPHPLPFPLWEPDVS